MRDESLWVNHKKKFALSVNKIQQDDRCVEDVEKSIFYHVLFAGNALSIVNFAIQY